LGGSYEDTKRTPLFNARQTLLFDAVQKNKVEEIEMLVKDGAEINQTTKPGNTPLMIAAALGHTEAVVWLLNNGADWTMKNEEKTALDWVKGKASSKGAGDAINAWIEAPNERMREAVEAGNVPVVETFLRNGADPNGATEDTGQTPLSIAAQNNRIKSMEVLVRAGAKINQTTKPGNTPLMIAAASGHTEAVVWLLNNGADWRLKNEEKTALDWVKGKASSKGAGDAINAWIEALNERMREAAAKGEEVKVKECLSEGADPNAVYEKGVQALTIAAQNNNVGCMEMLIKEGADINQLDNDRGTPLIRAALGGKTEAVVWLLHNRADWRLKDNTRKTALDWARLEEWGTSPPPKEVVTALEEWIWKNEALNKKMRQSLVGEYRRVAEVEIAREVKECLSEGADPNAVDHETRTTAFGSTPPWHGYPMLSIAAQNNRIKSMEVLVGAGAKIDKTTESGDTPLMIAAASGHTEAVEWLLARGADWRLKDDTGKTALETAWQQRFQSRRADGVAGALEAWITRNGSPADVDEMRKQKLTVELFREIKDQDIEGVRRCLHDGADPNGIEKFGDWITALSTAMQSNLFPLSPRSGGGAHPEYPHIQHYFGIMEVLVGAGADLNKVNGRGQTPLMIAAASGHTEAVVWLLNNGADWRLTDNTVKTALDVANNKRHTEVAAIIEAHIEAHIAE